MKRTASIQRKTNETDISISLNIDGSGIAKIDTGLGFFDHMLHHIAVHGLFDLDIRAVGDLHVDPHHTIEDVALVLGQVFYDALDSREGIVRTNHAYVPMDETLARVVIDLSGRPYSVIDIEWQSTSAGEIPVTLLEHFFESFTVTCRCNLHAQIYYGRDDHHKAEALFKAFGIALDRSTQIDPRRVGIPSTKGTLTA